jgi:hypothetical protein
VEFPISEQDAKTYKWLDQMRIAGVKSADHQCRKLRMGGVSFCAKTVTAWKTIESWKLLIKRKKGGKVSSRKLERTTEKAGIKGAYRLSLQVCEQRLAEARLA